MQTQSNKFLNKLLLFHQNFVCLEKEKVDEGERCMGCKVRDDSIVPLVSVHRGTKEWAVRIDITITKGSTGSGICNELEIEQTKQEGEMR